MTANNLKPIKLVDPNKDKTVELPMIAGSVGPEVMDIRKLYAETGYFTYDPGFTSTGSCESKITYIDGDKGVLLHRGYAIEDLAEHCDFLEVAYLLMNGELPNPTEKAKFEHDITYHTNRWPTSSAASAATRTRWPSCAVWSARCPPSIMIRPTSRIRASG